MGPNDIGTRAAYHEITEERQSSHCTVRADDRGIWNSFKAWYLIALHILASVAFVAVMVSLNDRNFKIGTGETIMVIEDGLYQAQVTGLISLALVLIRLIASACSILLAWRIVVILLEKRGISLRELTWLVDWRVPIVPRRRTPLIWSLWATAAVMLLWPQAFVAPLASSSVSWVPRIQIMKDSVSANITAMSDEANWAARLYIDWRQKTVVAGAAMTSQNPAYAYNNASALPLRRYFNSTSPNPAGSTVPIPENSIADMILPYFAVDLEWIDASSTNLSIYAGAQDYEYVNPDFGIRAMGATAIIKPAKWDANAAQPAAPTIYRGTHIVAIKLRTLNFGDILPDGTIVSNTTKCPSQDTEFGQMPEVEQYQVNIVNGDKETVAYDCYMLAQGSIVAGAIAAQDCIVSTSQNTSDMYATRHIQRNDNAVQNHWLTSLSIDFMSDVLKYTVLLNYSAPWINNDLDTYTAGTLQLGYHAAFSAIIKTLGDTSEPITYRAAVPMIAASIDNHKLYIWLGMTLCLTVSAVMVAIAGSRSRAKTIRNSSLAALLMDLSGVSHGRGQAGLCNAVTLSKNDRKLGLLRWKGDPRDCAKIVVEATRGDEGWRGDDGVVMRDGGFQASRGERDGYV